MGTKERKEREKEARREEIITAAEQVFFHKGLALATMDEIAEAAELSKGTLYLYYKSKEDLYIAVALRGTAIMERMFREAAAGDGHPFQLLSNLGDAYLSYFKQYRNYYRMTYFFDVRDIHGMVSPEMQQECDAWSNRIWHSVVGIIQKGIDQGYLRDDTDPLQAGVMLWANCDGLMRLFDGHEAEWLDSNGMNLDDVLRTSSRCLIRGMMSDKGLKSAATLFAEENALPLRRVRASRQSKK